MIYVNLNIIFYTHVEKSLCVKDKLCMLPRGHFFFFGGGWGEGGGGEGGWGSHPKDYYQHQQAEQNQSSLRPDLGG